MVSIATKRILSLASLLLGNLIPLAGTLFFGWVLFDVVFIYWCETVIILVLATLDHSIVLSKQRRYLQAMAQLGKCLMFGISLVVFLVFISILFGVDLVPNATIIDAFVATAYPSLIRTFWGIAAFGCSQLFAFALSQIRDNQSIVPKRRPLIHGLSNRIYALSLFLVIIFGVADVYLDASDYRMLMIIFTVAVTVSDIRSFIKTRRWESDET